MSAEYAPFLTLLLLAPISLFWGAVVVLQMMWGVLRRGPMRFFCGKRRATRPDVLNDPSLGTHHYARMKNIRLHYVSKGPEGRPLVLFLHGFPELWYSWRYQLKEFGNDYRTVAVDMRGYGESDRPQGVAEYRMEKLTGDVKELIEYLGYDKCFLVGHDWGGAVAWEFATRHPKMVEKLIVCNIPNPHAMLKYMQSNLSQFLKSWYIFFFQLPFLPEIQMGSDDLALVKQHLTSKDSGIQSANMSDEDLEAFLYTFKDCVDRTGPINYYRAAIRYKPDTLDFDTVKSPTMIIWGTRDVYLERQMAEASKRYVDNVCYVCYIEGVSHWVQQDEPELVNKYIRDFLSDNKVALLRK